MDFAYRGDRYALFGMDACVPPPSSAPMPPARSEALAPPELEQVLTFPLPGNVRLPPWKDCRGFRVRYLRLGRGGLPRVDVCCAGPCASGQ